jgi:hypothetical protein
MFAQGIKTPPSTMTLEDRKLLDRFSDLYDKAEVSDLASELQLDE